jgi:hypothetical protein
LCGKIEEEEAEEYRQLTPVQDGPEAPGSVGHEIGESHFARQHESDRPGEETKKEQQPAERLQHACETW